jgi:hypothetical protein
VGNPLGKYPLERQENDLKEVLRIYESKWIRSLEKNEYVDVTQESWG